MPGYNCSHFWHAAVAHLDVEFVANLVQLVMGRKVFSEQSQEFLANNVGFDMLTKQWVKPRDGSFPLFLFFWNQRYLHSPVYQCVHFNA